MGWAIYGFAQKIYDAGDETAAGFKAAAQIMSGNGGKVIHTYFFSAALIVFVAAVGLLAAKDLGIVLKKYGAKFVVLGLLITFIGAGATYACTAFCKGTNQYAVTGVYTGAMTSSPGLASALETAELQATDLANHYEQESALNRQSLIRVLALNEKYAGLTEENTPVLTDEMSRISSIRRPRRSASARPSAIRSA